MTQINIDTFVNKFDVKKKEFLASAKSLISDLDSKSLIAELSSLPMEHWHEFLNIMMGRTGDYRTNAMPHLRIYLHREEPSLYIEPNFPISHVGSISRSIKSDEVKGLYAKVDAHFAKLRTQEQKPCQFYFGSEVGGD